MSNRNFRAVVVEREADEACYVHLDAYGDIGIDGKTVMLKLRPGTDIERARALTDLLNGTIMTLSADDLYKDVDDLFDRTIDGDGGL